MKAFRRLLGGDREAGANGATEPTVAGAQPSRAPSQAADELTAYEAERQYELELAREEARRLDELQQRQLKYADRSWTPPRQGGERRADDEEAGSAEG